MKFLFLSLLPATVLTEALGISPLPIGGIATTLPCPLYTPSRDTIPDQYIVKMKSSAVQAVMDVAINLLQQPVLFKYGLSDFLGFAAKMDLTTLTAMRLMPGLEYIEQDFVVRANVPMEKRAFVTQANSSWGLARVSNRAKGGNSYTYDNSGGAGTCIYVVDTGIEASHPDFGGRAALVANYAGDGINNDANGHGTHCAGIAGSTTYGVAKRSVLLGVKVLDGQGQGSGSAVLAGINFVASDSTSRSGCPRGFVATMSLGGPSSQTVNKAVANIVNSGVFVAVAAGNDYVNANDISPASEPTSFTVGATNSTDGFANFSNWGSSVDMLAPGVAIPSTWINGQYAVVSGTSMAAPHVAGVASYLLGYEGRYSPANMRLRLNNLATKGAIVASTLPAGTSNSLLYNNSGK